MRLTSVFFIMIAVVILAAIFQLGIVISLAHIAVAVAAILLMRLYLTMVDPFYLEWYRFPKGVHYSPQSFFMLPFPFLRMYNSKKYGIYNVFQLPYKCYYDISVVGDHWNKVGGVSFGRLHRNSIRLGWRPKNENYFECCFYWYECGIRKESTPFELCWGTNHYITIDNDMFSVYNMHIEVKGDYLHLDGSKPIAVFEYDDYNIKHTQRRYKFILVPYFGGRVARTPHKMNVQYITKKYHI